MYAAERNGATNARRRLGSHPSGGGGQHNDDSPNVQMNDDCYPPMPQNETAVAYSVRRPADRGGGRQRLRQRRRGGDAHRRRRQELGEHPGHAAVRRHPRLLQRRRPRRSPTAAATAPSTSPSSASSGRCRSPRSRSSSRSTTARPGRRAGRPREWSQLRLHHRHRRRVDLQRQGVHRRRQHPDQPALRPHLRDLHQVPHRSRTGSATTARSSSPTPTRSRPPTRCCPRWSHTAGVAGRPRRRRHRLVGQPVQRARWSRRTAPSTSATSPRSATTRSTTFCFQKSTDGGRPSCRPRSRSTSRASSRTTSTRRDDLLPPTVFRAPNTPSLAYSPTTGTLVYVYQNNINRPISGGGHLLPASARRRAALVGRQVPVDRRAGRTRPQRPVLPLGRTPTRRGGST